MTAPCEDALPYKEATIAFLSATYLFEMYLQIRQHRLFSVTQIPAELQGVVSQDVYDKARRYSRDKSWYVFASMTFSQVETVLILMFNGLPYLWYFAGDLLESFGVNHADHEIMQSMVFLYLSTIYQVVVHLPWNLYYTFVLEAAHGFNKQTLSFYFVDQAKSLLLTITVTLVIAAPLLAIIQSSGEHFYIYAWLFVFLFSLVSVTVYADYIAPLFDKFEPLPAGSLREKIEALATKIKFPLGRLLLVHASKRSSHSNAYYYGFLTSKTIVLFDTLIGLEGSEPTSDTQSEEEKPKCTEEEIVGVLSHELGHWSLLHTFKHFCLAQVNAFVSFWLFGQLMHCESVYVSFGFDTMPTLIGLVLILQFIFSPLNVLTSFAVNKLTRRYEYQADAFAHTLGYGHALQQALIKLQVGNLGNMNPDHLYSEYHYSHPPLVERLHALRALDKKSG